ncbi:hypothetical protein LTR08_003672 [Meristemomyces frigidus]|nr:hypothetical protein LTR08_003672 [Meristemomyces frigidus]
MAKSKPHQTATKKARSEIGTKVSKVSKISKQLARERAAAAAAKVFGIPELLENILRRLTFHDLLFSQQVSVDFRATVVWSLALKRKLFLAPTIASDFVWVIDCHKTFSVVWKIARKDVRRKDVVRQPYIFHPALFFSAHSSGTLIATRSGRKPKSRSTYLDFHVDPLKSMEPTASCGNMFITQPAVQEAALHYYIFDRDIVKTPEPRALIEELDHQDGIRFKDVLKAIKTTIGETCCGEEHGEIVIYLKFDDDVMVFPSFRELEEINRRGRFGRWG